MSPSRLALTLTLFALGACSESSSGVAPDACAAGACADVAPGDVGEGDVTPSDIASRDVAGDVTSSDLGADVTPGLDASADVAADAAVAPPVDAPPPCPLYQMRCEGACVPTSVDPANCGACGRRCADGQVCNGGVCGTTCPAGLTACGGRCVNVQSDSAHCGACGAACPTGQGCVAGACRRLMILDPTAVTCAGGAGPLVDLGEGACAGAVAETTFRWAVCSCTTIGVSAPLRTDGFDSTRGPYTPGGTGAGVGANGTFSSSSTTDVGGALWIGNAGPWGNSSPYTVAQVLRANGDYSGASTLTVNDEAYVNGAVRTSSRVAITGALHIPEGAATVGDLSARRITREPVTVSPPCDCGASARLPMERWIADARARNDDARLGLDPMALMNTDTPQRLDLPCGRYYLRGIASSAPVTIVAHGRTALFIDGDINQSQALTITLDPTAELDVVVGGRFGISAPLTLGSPAYPALTRVYVASREGLSLTSGTVLGANLYVPDGRIGTSGSLEVYGAIFVGELSASNALTVHYDRAVLRVGDPCHPDTPVVPGDAGVSDAGAGDAGVRDAGRGDAGAPMCTSCRDCANQACTGGRCGACTSDSECCAPLQCWMGRCVVIPG